MSPTPRAAGVLAVIALSALFLPLGLVALAAVALCGATAVDALSVRAAPALQRSLPRVLSRGVRAPLRVAAPRLPGGLRVRQAAPPDLEVSPAEGEGGLEATVLPRRCGRHALPGVADRREGPLGLGRWTHPARQEHEVLVYPDLPAARRLALAVRQGRFRDQGQRSRGPLGLGTEFESIREYLPDDDVRQVNWPATQRMGRPMSNQYRLESDRDVICLVDCGRLMAAPTPASEGRPPDRTRLDVALDAVAAVGLVADEVGDRCGAVAFDDGIRRLLRPRRAGGDAVVRALFDLEPRPIDSDYELAFRTVKGAKRALVIVLTDVLEESAAGPLVDAVPVLTRRHAVVVASASDLELELIVSTPPRRSIDVYAAATALEVLDARARVGRRLGAAGAQVLEAPANRLGAACVRTYLRAKARARL